MKINSKKIMIWTIAIASVIILPDLSMYYERYKLNSEKLPDKYKMYTELDSLKDGYYEVLKIDGGFIEPVLQASDSTIVIIWGHGNEGKKGDTVENNWSKINLEGQIVNVLSYRYSNPQNHDYQTFNDYIVDVEHNTYNTWIKNDDTFNHPIKNIAENKKFSKEEAKQIISGKVYMTQKYLNSPSVDQEATVKLMVYKDNTWNYLLTDKSWMESPAYITNDKEVKYDGSTYNIDKNSSLIRREFVHKELLNEYSFWNIGQNFRWGTGNGSGRSKWAGTSYFKIKMPEKMLHFKQSVDIGEQGDLRDRFSYFIYKPKNGTYLLLNDTQNRIYYLIRPKSPFPHQK